MYPLIAGCVNVGDLLASVCHRNTFCYAGQKFHCYYTLLFYVFYATLILISLPSPHQLQSLRIAVTEGLTSSDGRTGHAIELV